MSLIDIRNLATPKRAVESLFVALLHIVLLLAVFMSGGESHAQDLLIYEAEPPLGIDLFSCKGSVSERFVSLYCRPLYRFQYVVEAGADAYEPVLAEPGYEKDELSCTVRIRDDAYFFRPSGDGGRIFQGDSVKITAQDIVSTYKHLVDPKTELRNSRYADNLVRHVQDMVAVGEDRVRVIFKPGMKPAPPRAVLEFPVVPSEAVPSAARVVLNPKRNSPYYKYQQNPWGSGPFVYVGKKERAGTTIWRFARSGECDMDEFAGIELSSNYDRMQIGGILKTARPANNACIPSVPLGLLSEVDPNYDQVKLFRPTVEEIMFNTRKPPFDDWRVRAALSVYIKRETLVRHYNDEADLVTGPVPANYFFYCKTCEIPYYSHNRDLGDSLLIQAGWTRDEYENLWMKDGMPLTVELLGFTGTTGSFVSELVYNIQQGWTDAGIKAESKLVTSSDYNRRLTERDFEAAFHILSYNVIPDLYKRFGSDSKHNICGLKDAVFDSLWNTLLGDASVAEEGNLWHQIHLRLGELVPGAFLWTPHKYAVYSSWIDIGIHFHAYNFLALIEKWKIED